MKVLSIGGGGGMGRTTARTALGFQFVERIVLAGIDYERAARFARSLDDPRISAISLDITDEESLRQAIRQCDVVLNSSGPFFRFGLPVLRAAIAEGKHYCDICDDWEPTLDMIGLHEEAQSKGVTAVIGLGASPGIANLLAVKAAEQLDEVHELYSAWRLSNAHNEDDGFFDEGESNTDAAAVHLVHCLTEKIPLVRNGAVEERLPLEHCRIDYPGHGELDIWSIGHPEAVTLPRHYPGLRNCLNGMLGVDGIIDDLRQLADQVRAGAMSLEQAAALLTSDGGREKRRQRLQENEAPDAPGILAFAAGLKDGRPARAGARLKRVPGGGMSAVTGIPHALFLPLLRQGAIKGAGVFAPEQAVDADAFFALLDGFAEGRDCGLSVTFAH
ncbi:saccharopine dehydrogenase family protein [Pseudomonas aeruginosa]|uniref:saccharopine dehydrogenase family protein n=1 Tax=Pseudomonas aeruginosa TaxID=287 RepID=UPI0027773359|nr:saccharopine dehydrogenase NADP-binding domain-containing protein [Pseudomonas aeruginosa]MED5476587.1 saccharopine dehydrogenase NADP-binding domain-containing protein [Pseudomonadota bacterium]